MDQIKIDNLEIFAFHGVLPEENQNGQSFFVNAVLDTNTRIAGLSDDLEKTTNYGEVCEFIAKEMTAHVFQLIETVAENIAVKLLLCFDKIEGITLEIRKPSAPIGLVFESVSVCVTRRWHTTFIGFGTNMGNREEYIKKALESFEENKLCVVEKVSSILRSTPYGGIENQGEFLNGVIQIRTLLPPEELLEFLHELEIQAGRKREERWGPRTLDLDILLYDDLIMDSEQLVIPHADMGNRDFVLYPLAEIAGYVRHPMTKCTIHEMLEELKNTKTQHLILS